MLRNPLPNRPTPTPARGTPLGPDAARRRAATAGPVNFEPARDSLGHTARLEHVRLYPVLGVPLEVATNSSDVLTAADRAFGGWNALVTERVESVTPGSLRVIVHAGRPWEVRPTGFVYRAHGECLLAAAESNILTANPEHGHALAFVTPELVAAEAVFRKYVLDWLARLLVSRQDRVPLAAAAVVRNGRTILLVGPPGSGKSTLCYACLKADFQLLTEDVIHVSVRDGLRLWGVPGGLHLHADAARPFPELADRVPELQPDGKLLLTVETARLGANKLALQGERPVVCLLRRQRRTGSAVEPAEPAAVRAALTHLVEPGFDLHPQLGEIAARLAAEPAYQLTVGTDPGAAVKRLQALSEG